RPGADPATGEGSRVRPRGGAGAGGGRRRRGPRAARALRRADAADEDARRRPRTAAARAARRLAVREEQAVAVAPHAALVPERDEVEVGSHPRVALQLAPPLEVA